VPFGGGATAGAWPNAPSGAMPIIVWRRPPAGAPGGGWAAGGWAAGGWAAGAGGWATGAAGGAMPIIVPRKRLSGWGGEKPTTV